MFTYRLDNGDNPNRRPCTNCRRDVPAETIHTCEAFTVDRAVVEERHERLVAGADTGFCHCNGFFRGSDHCQCCGCEEHEGIANQRAGGRLTEQEKLAPGTCNHVCDGVGCTFEHDARGRVI